MTSICCTVGCGRYGKDRKGNQRWRCEGCGRTFTEAQPRPLGDMRIAEDEHKVKEEQQ